MLEDVSEALLQLLPEVAFRRRRGGGISDACERDQDGKETESVEKEVSGHAEQSHGEATERRTKHARHIKLRRVERDGVGEVFSRDKLRHQRLISWRVK